MYASRCAFAPSATLRLRRVRNSCEMIRLEGWGQKKVESATRFELDSRPRKLRAGAPDRVVARGEGLTVGTGDDVDEVVGDLGLTGPVKLHLELDDHLLLLKAKRARERERRAERVSAPDRIRSAGLERRTAFLEAFSMALRRAETCGAMGRVSGFGRGGPPNVETQSRARHAPRRRGPRRERRR